MERRPYLLPGGSKPSKASVLLKLAAAKNAEILKEKTIGEHREAQAKLASVRPISPLLAAEQRLCGGVPCEWIAPRKAPKEQILLYLHGGSWAYGDLKTARPMAALLAEYSGCHVLTVEYRLSPEHPFPAGLTDCYNVYSWLLEQGVRPGQIALVGDSAGGNLALCVMHLMLQDGMGLPACAALASPVTDMRESSAIVQSGDDLIYTNYLGRKSDIFTLYATEKGDRSSSLLSPVTGDLSAFPPLLIHTGADEPLARDSLAFSEKAYRQGADVKLKLWNGMFHDFTIVGITLKESRQSVKELTEFCSLHLAE